MKFLPDGFNIKELERNVKNKWRWEWLKETDVNGDNWGDWLRKPDIAGAAFCECCGKTIKYGSSGKKGLKNHASDLNHLKKKKTVKTNQVRFIYRNYTRLIDFISIHVPDVFFRHVNVIPVGILFQAVD